MTEQELARHWRDKFMRLTREELAPLIGYTPAAIYFLENGPSERIHSRAWHRYKCACLAAQIMKEQHENIANWKWGQP